MSISITPALSMANAAVGQNFPVIPLSGIIPPATPNGQTDGGNIVCFNESQCGVIVTLSPLGSSFRIPAGGWSDPIPVQYGGTNISGVQVQVEYIMSAVTPLVSQFGIDYFFPGEKVVRVKTLGNSPIGGNISVSSYPYTLISAKDIPIIVNTNVQVLSPIAPSPPGVAVLSARFQVSFNVGAGNTNNGVITVSVSIDSPMVGVVTQNMFSMTGTQMSGTAINKGSLTSLQAMFLDVLPGQSIVVNYHNAALGTINDQVTATIELVA